jgi:hypothetical protein
LQITIRKRRDKPPWVGQKSLLGRLERRRQQTARSLHEGPTCLGHPLHHQVKKDETQRKPAVNALFNVKISSYDQADRIICVIVISNYNENMKPAVETIISMYVGQLDRMRNLI